jgi:hypothetical protein
MQRLKKFLKFFLPTVFVLIAFCLTIFIFPGIFFAHQITYKTFTVYSDRPIDKNIEFVLDDTIRRLATSDLYNSGQRYTIYLCNDLWRLRIFNFGNVDVGAIAYGDVTEDIFFRPVDIKNNKIIPPDSWQFAKKPSTFDDRPLSYFIAHETTHILESVYTGRRSWKSPTWLIEGYADYVGKAGEFDFAENLRLYKENAPELDPSQGLYRRYHLTIAYLLDIKKMNIKDIFANPPSEEKILEELKTFEISG